MADLFAFRDSAKGRDESDTAQAAEPVAVVSPAGDVPRLAHDDETFRSGPVIADDTDKAGSEQSIAETTATTGTSVKDEAVGKPTTTLEPAGDEADDRATVVGPQASLDLPAGYENPLQAAQTSSDGGGGGSDSASTTVGGGGSESSSGTTIGGS